MADTNSAVKSAPLTSPVEKLREAKQLKEEGASLFKAGEWKKAARKYHYALMYVKGLLTTLEDIKSMMGAPSNSDINPFAEKLTPEQKDEATKLSTALSNNLAVCMLKLEKWDNAVKHSSTVLECEPNNVKALYRRGTALMKMGRLDECKEDLQQALDLDPTDQSLRKQYGILQEMLKNYWKEEKQKYQKMFQTEEGGAPPT